LGVEGNLPYSGTVVGTVEGTEHIAAGTVDMEASFVGAACAAFAEDAVVMVAVVVVELPVEVAEVAEVAEAVEVVEVVEVATAVVVVVVAVAVVAFALLKLAVGWVVGFEHHQER
jgi:hypothetical protein